MNVSIINAIRLSSALLAALSLPAWASEASDLDFFTELPIVYSVTRLPQALADTPGAVTVIDRDMIRRSGAREVADLLRLVPGYMVGGFNGANPLALYHSALDEAGTRNQVLIDGRSVYSSFYTGDTHRGTMDVVLEDVERIEVLRGSNSAAYGANAFLGVINIVTKHTSDTLGGMLSVTSGDNGVLDTVARYGGAINKASFRITATERHDHGYLNAYDDKRFRHATLRADIETSPNSILMINAGAGVLNSQEGFTGTVNNPERDVNWSDAYAQGQWRYIIAPGEEIRVSAMITQEHFSDQYNFTPVPGVVINNSGIGRRTQFEVQHSFAMAGSTRVVWGIGSHSESVKSRPIFAKDEVSFQTLRAFGNAEWRPHPQWIVNAGLFIEDHEQAGAATAPRLAVNFHLTPEHTFRAGLTRAFRQPTNFELAGDIRIYLGNTQLARGVLSSGVAAAEKINSREIGYLGEFRAVHATLDVRVFEERISDLLRQNRIVVLPSLPASGTLANDYENLTGPTIRGLEYQLRWTPLPGTDILANQTFLQPSVEDYFYTQEYLIKTPRHISTLALMQRFSGGTDLSLILSAMDTMSWRGYSDRLQPTERLDIRLGHRFKLGATHAEAAITVQAANGSQQAHLPRKQFEFDRHIFASLKLDF